MIKFNPYRDIFIVQCQHNLYLYREKMKDLLKAGKYIHFYEGHKKIKGIIIKTSFDKRIYITIEDESGKLNNYLLSVDETVTLYNKPPEIKYNELDPFGEEDWDDDIENESLMIKENKFYDDFEISDLDINYNNCEDVIYKNHWYKIERPHYYTKKIKKFLFFNKKVDDIRTTTDIIKLRDFYCDGVELVLYYKKEYVDGEIITSKYHKHITIYKELLGDRYNILSLRCLISSENINRNPKLDPFGEENWDEDDTENESFRKIYEDVDDNEKSFIPFKLREEIVPGFVWDKKTENDCYFNRVDQDRKYPFVSSHKGIEKNTEYLSEIKKRLLNNMVSFYRHNYADGTIEKKNGKVVNIHYNNHGVLIFRLSLLHIYAVDERKPVIFKTIERKFNEMDPFGEEDWND